MEEDAEFPGYVVNMTSSMVHIRKDTDEQTYNWITRCGWKWAGKNYAFSSQQENWKQCPKYYRVKDVNDNDDDDDNNNRSSSTLSSSENSSWVRWHVREMLPWLILNCICHPGVRNLTETGVRNLTETFRLSSDVRNQ